MFGKEGSVLVWKYYNKVFKIKIYWLTSDCRRLQQAVTGLVQTGLSACVLRGAVQAWRTQVHMLPSARIMTHIKTIHNPNGHADIYVAFTRMRNEAFRKEGNLCTHGFQKVLGTSWFYFQIPPDSWEYKEW